MQVVSTAQVTVPNFIARNKLPKQVVDTNKSIKFMTNPTSKPKYIKRKPFYATMRQSIDHLDDHPDHQNQTLMTQQNTMMNTGHFTELHQRIDSQGWLTTESIPDYVPAETPEGMHGSTHDQDLTAVVGVSDLAEDQLESSNLSHYNSDFNKTSSVTLGAKNQSSGMLKYETSSSVVNKSQANKIPVEGRFIKSMNIPALVTQPTQPSHHQQSISDLEQEKPSIQSLINQVQRYKLARRQKSISNSNGSHRMAGPGMISPPAQQLFSPNFAQLSQMHQEPDQVEDYEYVLSRKTSADPAKSKTRRPKS